MLKNHHIVLDVDADVARSFDLPSELIPEIPELMADLWAMGGSPEAVIELLEPLKPRRSTGALDLACGKGAVAINLVKELGIKAAGVDGVEAFVREAKERAEELGLSSRCKFEQGDVRDAVREYRLFDVVMQTCAGNVLGSVRETIAALRKCVVPSGHMVIQDAFLTERSTRGASDSQGLLTHAQMIEALSSQGDTIVGELILDRAETAEKNRANVRLISARADKLAVSRPELAPALSEYIRRLEKQTEALEDHVACGLWLVQLPSEPKGHII